MKIVILAAGYATRLYPLTMDKPKALLEVAGKTILGHLLDKLAAVRPSPEVFLVTNARFFRPFEQWAAHSGAGRRIRVLNDGTSSNEDRLGAIGDLEFAVENGPVADDLLVLAGDNLFEGELGEFIRFAAGRDAPAIGVHELKDPALGALRYGMVEIAPDRRITAIEEKPERPRSPYASMGIYYLPHSSLGYIKRYLSGSEKKDAPGYYMTWLLARTPVYAFPFGGRWYDIGSADQLEQASREYAGA